MSANATGWVWHHSRVGGNDLLVLLAIADEANHWGQDARPGVDRIASMTKIDRSTVYRSIKRLVEMGELTADTTGGGRGRRTVYRLPRMEVPPPQKTVASCDTPPAKEPSQFATVRPPKPSQNRRKTVAKPSHPHAQNADTLSLPLSQNRESARATQIPTNFEPDTQGQELAQRLGLDVARELALFRAHYQASLRLSSNWQSKWEAWCHRAVSQFGQRPKPPVDLARWQRESQEAAERLAGYR